MCILADIDGGRCGGVLNWGHFIPRNKSKYLKYDLATFAQCGAHNMMHDSKKTGGGDPIFSLWFCKTFGLDALDAISTEQRLHLGASGKRSVPELRALFSDYTKLYDNRYTAPIGNIKEMVLSGYYGDVLKMCYTKRVTVG